MGTYGGEDVPTPTASMAQNGDPDALSCHLSNGQKGLAIMQTSVSMLSPEFVLGIQSKAG